MKSQHFHFRINYIGTLKTVFTNRAFVIMFFVLGGNMSFISTLATKMEQIMCRSDSFVNLPHRLY